MLLYTFVSKTTCYITGTEEHFPTWAVTSDDSDSRKFSTKASNYLIAILTSGHLSDPRAITLLVTSGLLTFVALIIDCLTKWAY